MNTPPGARAKQIVDMLNSDWPIGPVGVRTLATSEMVETVGTTMDRLWWDRPFTVAGVDIGAGTATLHLVTSFGASQDIAIRTDSDTMVDRFDVELNKPTIASWGDVDTELTKSGARYSYQVARVNDGRCDPVAGTNTTQSLPLASIFKLYVLYALSEAVKAGTVSWTDKLTITGQAKAVGSSGLEKLAPGAQVTVRTAADKMIANSDNMATDLLIDRVGTPAVERALAKAGHHDPASMTPFPTMHELFSVGWGKPDLREQWKEAAGPEARAQLLAQTNSRPYEPDPARTHTPASTYGAEWYGSAQDICRVHAALQAGAIGAAAPVKDIMSAIPGIDLDPRQWPYVGAKAGNLPGDLTFSWYAVDGTGQPWVVSFQLNWPRYHGSSAGAWAMSIIKQVFAMLPQRA
ncbi:MAG: class A beta-lactamase-related serine hydrolase [Mycobacteriaceae bacterium]|nr:class A beta-lactamase-related serine hydrolase [Mycobacteriaceae bacterium]